jgi:hypothetical protein
MEFYIQTKHIHEFASMKALCPLKRVHSRSHPLPHMTGTMARRDGGEVVARDGPAAETGAAAAEGQRVHVPRVLWKQQQQQQREERGEGGCQGRDHGANTALTEP